MNRRDAIKQTALIMGYAVSASAATAIMSGCEVDSGPSWKPSHLSADQVSLVAEIAERIVPKTDTPGAKDVMVERFIDVLLGNYLEKPEVTIFMAGLGDINKRSQDTFQKPFVGVSDSEKDQILKQLATETVEMMEANPRAKKPFFAMVRELSLLGYFTSETVGKEVLAYDPVPGTYLNCIPLEENGGVNWAI